MKKSFIILNFISLSFSLLICCLQNSSPFYKQKITLQDEAQAGMVLKDSLYNIEIVYIPAGTIRFDADYERHEMVVF